MKLKVRTAPDFSSNSEKHKAALALGDEMHTLWQRNVIDEFKSLPNDDIRERLHSTAFPYAVLTERWSNNYNISSCFRNANAFNAKEAFYIGDKRFDRRGLCGIHEYTDIHWLSSIDDIVSLKEKYHFVAIDNVPGAQPLDDYEWKDNSLMVFGCEASGITPDMLSLCDEVVHVRQFGSVRSLNAATASGIVLNDFVTKYNRKNKC